MMVTSPSFQRCKLGQSINFYFVLNQEENPIYPAIGCIYRIYVWHFIYPSAVIRNLQKLAEMKTEMGAAEQKGNETGEFELPGFRFHPTEQELVGFYLKKMVQGKLHNFSYIGVLDLYQYDPWDLPSLGRLGERELFFFVPRDKKCQNGGRPSRITACGYWKATGSDRHVRDEHGKALGLKKTLVFYRGRAPRGEKTDWIMNEYRMLDSNERYRVS